MNFPAPISQIHIARNGELLGLVDSDKIADELERGSLLSTDFFYDEKKSEWLPLSEWKHPIRAKNLARETAPAEAGAKSGERARSSRRPKKAPKTKTGCATSFGGWVLCLFALAASIWLWITNQSLSDQVNAAQQVVESSKQSVKTAMKEEEALTEVTPPGHIRCIIVQQKGGEDVSVLSGVTISLYHREDVAKALNAAQSIDSLGTNDNFSASADKLKAALATPLALALSDSDGRVDLEVPQTGNFVLLADANSKATEGDDRFVWLVGIKASGQPSGIVLLSDRNAFSKERSQMSIKDVNPFIVP